LAWCYIFSEFSAIPQIGFFGLFVGVPGKPCLVASQDSYSIIPSMNFFFKKKSQLFFLYNYFSFLLLHCCHPPAKKKKKLKKCGHKEKKTTHLKKLT
jgi:hypothetical protein